MTIAIFTRLQVPFMMDNSNISRQQSTALWNIVITVCLPLLAIVNDLVICYMVTSMLEWFSWQLCEFLGN